jgi:hypothetical protein
MEPCPILRYGFFFGMSSFTSFDERRMVKTGIISHGGLQEAAGFIRGLEPLHASTLNDFCFWNESTKHAGCYYGSPCSSLVSRPSECLRFGEYYSSLMAEWLDTHARPIDHIGLAGYVALARIYGPNCIYRLLSSLFVWLL